MIITIINTIMIIIDGCKQIMIVNDASRVVIQIVASHIEWLTLALSQNGRRRKWVKQMCLCEVYF